MTQLLVGVTILILLILMARGLANPGIMLALMWATYVIEHVVQQNAFFLSHSWAINVALTLATVVAVGKAYLDGRYKGLVLTRAHLLMFALFALTGLSYFWSVDPQSTYKYIKKGLPYIVAFTIVAPFCAFSPQQIDKAVKVVLYFGSFLLLVLAFSSMGNRAVVLDYVAGQEVEANPLAAATFGGYLTICAVFYIYSHKSRNVLAFAFYVSLALLGVYTIIRSGSRGQLLAVLVACFIWLPVTARIAAKRSSIFALILGAIMIYVAILGVGMVAGGGRWQHAEEAAVNRFEAITYLIGQMIEAGPMAWMVGLGNSASYSLVGGYPHNVPGEVLAEEGLIGFALYIGFMMVVTLTGFKVMREKNVDQKARVNTGLLLTLFTFQFGLGLKQSSLVASSGIFCLGLCITIFAQRIKKQSSNKVTMLTPRAHDARFLDMRANPN